MSASEVPRQTQDGIRALHPADLDRVVEIDAALTGRRRTGFYERRLAAAMRHPGDYVYTGCEHAGALAGFLLARISRGEFGGGAPTGYVDAMGVTPASQRHGIGGTLMAAARELLARKGVTTIRTQADWRNASMLRLFDKTGFVLAPTYILERDVRAPLDPPAESVATEEAHEVDYSVPRGADFAPLAHDRIPCRDLRPADLEALVRIDAALTGAERRTYYKAKLEEIFGQSGLRVSMVADVDGRVAGFAMARVDFGEFARTEPFAVLDTLAVSAEDSSRGIGTALVSQLLTNLATLRVDSIRTEVDARQIPLQGFFQHAGFRPSQQLAFRCGPKA